MGNDKKSPVRDTTGGSVPDREYFRSAVARFRDARPQYERLAAYLKGWFTEKALGFGIYPIVMSRAKSLESFAEKICRPGKHYRDPLREMPDLCGVRVITHTLDQVNALAGVVEREFIVDPAQTEDTQERLDVDKFGYLSRHFLLQLKSVPEIPGLDAAARRALAGIRFELQLRTIAQHAWADINHELGYKNEFRLPRRWQREFARLAAMLELCDQGFLAVKDALRTYESSYTAYMTQEELRVLVHRLEILHEIDPGNTSVMHRLIRVYLALEDNKALLTDALARFGTALEAHPPAQRDMGVALCQINPPGSEPYDEGIGRLRRAVHADPSDVDALCSLGGALRKRGEIREAVECYRKACEIDSTNPYPLGNYIAEELIEKRDPDIVHHFRSAIAAAAERCRRQIEVDVNLPWALFDLGIFSLYLGEGAESAGHYARGIVDSVHDWMIRSAHKPIKRFLENGVALPGLEAINTLLNLARWVRASPEQRAKSPWRPASGKVSFDPGPVLVLSGGCAGLVPEDQPGLAELGKLLDGFRGTIVAGGTRSGIAHLAGELQSRAKKGSLRTIGYVPDRSMPGLTEWLDDRYSEQRHSTGRDFTVLEPLMFWQDYLGAGGDPAEVRLLGYNGGKIAAAEFRIALALGAKVGVVRGSGRAADAILSDLLWSDHDRLESLDLTRESITRFVTSG